MIAVRTHDGGIPPAPVGGAGQNGDRSNLITPSLSPFEQALTLISATALLQALGPAGVAQARQFLCRLLERFVSGGVAVRDAVCMIAFGGGKDSSYALAFVRAAQLILQAERGETFHLKVLMFRHSGMSNAVTENAGRVFDRLHLHGDPTVEIRLAEEGSLVPFDVNAPVPPSLKERNRAALLMAGHLTQGAGRPSFCNDCNAEMVRAFDVGVRTWHPHGVLTGDSPAELRVYHKWTMRMARHAGVDGPGRTFGDFIGSIAAIDDRYQVTVFGRQLASPPAPGGTSDPEFVSLYDSTRYDAGAHRELLRFLGFRFSRDSFVGTESDCSNPALMAHLRGLLLEQVRGQTYDRGVEEYVALWRELMVKKQIPTDLIRRFLARYETPSRRCRRRREAETLARNAYGLDEEALIAVAFSPFASGGRNLVAWLSRRGGSWGLSEAVVRDAITGEKQDDGAVATLTSVTGLTLQQIRHIFQSELIAPAIRRSGDGEFRRESGGGHFIVRLLEDDPHQVVVRTKLAPDAAEVEELISGR